MYIAKSYIDQKKYTWHKWKFPNIFVCLISASEIILMKMIEMNPVSSRAYDSLPVRIMCVNTSKLEYYM